MAQGGQKIETSVRTLIAPDSGYSAILNAIATWAYAFMASVCVGFGVIAAFIKQQIDVNELTTKVHRLEVLTLRVQTQTITITGKVSDALWV